MCHTVQAPMLNLRPSRLVLVYSPCLLLDSDGYVTKYVGLKLSFLLIPLLDFGVRVIMASDKELGSSLLLLKRIGVSSFLCIF